MFSYIRIFLIDKNMHKNYLILLLILLISCSSNEIIYKKVDSMPIKPNYKLSAESDSIAIGFKINEIAKSSEDDLFIKSINKVKAIIYAGDKQIDSAESSLINIEVNPINEKRNSNILTSFINWKKPKVISSNNLFFELIMCTDEVYYTTKLPINDIAKDNFGTPYLALSLKPIIRIENDSNVVFSIQAKRNYINEKEYLPNSEELRIEILNNSGKPVYSSNFNKNYFQVIKQVLPNEIGAIHTYNLNWSGKDTYNKKLPAGDYTVKLIIPAVPAPYFTQTTLQWRPK